MNLFVYGTLMADVLVVQLTGHLYAKEAAILDGYRKETPPNGYPRVIPDPAARVEGFLLRGVGRQALAVLDRYEDEGRLYRRTAVTVTMRGGHRRAAMTYVGLP
jgi:gamma-glutamylcyclotransferase (GGCT)/AIG2-like uncharacterized protein YtfP